MTVWNNCNLSSSMLLESRDTGSLVRFESASSGHFLNGTLPARFRVEPQLGTRLIEYELQISWLQTCGLQGWCCEMIHNIYMSYCTVVYVVAIYSHSCSLACILLMMPICSVANPDRALVWRMACKAATAASRFARPAMTFGAQFGLPDKLASASLCTR